MNAIVAELSAILSYFSPIILLFGIILGIVYYPRLDRAHRLLILFLSMALFIDILSRLAGEFYGNNLIFIPIFGLLELVLWSYIYFSCLMAIKNKIWLILVWILVLYNLYEIVTLLNVEPKDFNSNSRVFDSLAVVIISIVFYIKQIVNENPAKPGFMFLNTIIFAFYSLNLILYLPINFLINETSNIKFIFWSISLVLTLVFYSSIIRLIWIHGKNHKP